MPVPLIAGEGGVMVSLRVWGPWWSVQKGVAGLGEDMSSSVWSVRKFRYQTTK